MKISYLIITAFSLPLLILVLLAIISNQKNYQGTPEGERLKGCSKKTNCLCSEYKEHSSYISPLSFHRNTDEAWQKAMATIKKMGGKIVTRKDTYVHATFTSPFFHFVDDFELRLDKEQKVIHLRSSSRVGYSDLGANKKRVNTFFELTNK